MSQPNVMLITADQWPGSLLGAAGHPVIQTPTLDQLARNGVRYDRAYSECPICIPARRTLMTGTSTQKHGDRVFGTTTEMPDLPTMAQTFRDAGYQAYAVGKLHVYPPRDRIGFDDVLLAEEGRPHLGGIDDFEMFLRRPGSCRSAIRRRHEQQQLHAPAMASVGRMPLHELADADDVPGDQAARSEAAQFLVSVLYGAASAPDALGYLHGLLPAVRDAAGAVGRLVRRSRCSAFHAEDGP